MFLRDLGNFRENGSEIGIPVEHEDHGLCVPPAQIGKELFYRSKKDLFTFPELALSDENVLPLDADDNVGFAL